MTVRIGIVEDEAAQQAYVRNLIEKWFAGTDYRLQLVTCSGTEEYLFKYEKPGAFDILFLDIMLGASNGMELAKKIRSTDREVQIIFLTGVKDYVFEGYEIGAVRYLLKPVEAGELGRALSHCCQRLSEKSGEYLAFRYLGESLRIAFSDILLIRVRGHYLQMLTRDKVYEWKGSMNGVRESLDEKRFVFANRSELVNLEYVTRITRQECFLENGETLEISRGAYKGLNESCMEYYL